MRKYLYLFILIFGLTGCEDVIEVDLETEPPRLTVDAIIRLDTSESLTTAQIKVGLSSSFFEQNQIVQVEEMMIQNLDYQPTSPLDQNFVMFTETQPGVYEGSKNTGFFTSGELSLTIRYNDALFLATTTFAPGAPFDSVTQGENTLFSGEEIEVVVAFTDNGDRENFYIFDFDFNEFLVSEDEFYQGERFIFSYFYDDLEAGDTINISILGANESFFNYMNQLIVQSGGSQGPFQTPAGTVRGNIINTTGMDNAPITDSEERATNFALGYFAVVQEFKQQLTIE